jgi:hypothetical protein
MMSVAVVVTEYPAIVHAADSRVDIGQTILNDLAPATVDLDFYDRPAPFPGQVTNRDPSFDRGRSPRSLSR